ncbi:hypothetical protein Asppvi_002514 [Aspergillus pseudoviridinutans]|uniref:Amine oxidase n=1 Tax=Aspergillus pseudoviridinutans TaxID=1517512 RepID=A0A9P3B914_9EURO|nr:uncharacterized protein Asppvi_002514 [Aspergillus pseudoviridinutans]GIJ83684.1 hypothetical protein Asppvi_002514 [Aspergillus pseudoviridinutans]
MQAAENACIASAEVQEAIRLLELPEEAVVCIEPWTYGTEGMNDMSERIIMCYFYMRLGNHGDANHYVYPLDICVEVSGDLTVKWILSLPLGEHDRTGLVSEVGVKPFDRNKIHHNSEYHPDLREDLTLHDITYDGRSVFYRLSRTEMFVPYGDSRAPYPRKAAFDLGSNLAGVNSNNLKLGHIKYFDGYHHTSAGDPNVLPNVVCCHEIDDSILWKHTNYRTQNAVVTRLRVLVLQTIITVGKYEYIFCTYLHLTPLKMRGSTTRSAQQAVYLRHPSTWARQRHKEPSVGYTTVNHIVQSEMQLDLDVARGRVFKIISENVKNPMSRGPEGYKLVPHYSQMVLAHPSSYHSKRSEFAEHAVRVTRYSDEERYSAGEHTMQSLGREGIASWIRSRPAPVSVRNEDTVICHTFGTTHNPRVEDWPVMLAEKMTVSKPVKLFLEEPCIGRTRQLAGG